MNKNDIVKFANPIDPKESALRFLVLEDRGERVYVQDMNYCDTWTIKPTCVYRKSELVQA